MKPNWKSPYVVMFMVLLMYLVKVVMKLWIGSTVHSPTLIGDGSHNIADIFEALMAIGLIAMAGMRAGGSYPFGLKGIESVFSAVVGAALFLMACTIAFKGLTELYHYAVYGIGWSKIAPESAIVIDPKYLPWLLTATAGSAVLSMVVSRYQITVGRLTGEDILVADGQETRSDGMLEASVAAGVIGQYLCHAPWIEYVFALAVAWFMMGTAWEIFWRGLGGLLQRSIGHGIEENLKDCAMRTNGVLEVVDLKTFRVGSKGIVIMKVLTYANSAARRRMKHGMVSRMVSYLQQQEFTDAEFFIRFDEPDPNPHRRGFFLYKREDVALLAPNETLITHLRVCDVRHGCVTRWKDVEVSPDVGVQTLVSQKCIDELWITEGIDSSWCEKTLPALVRIEVVSSLLTSDYDF